MILTAENYFSKEADQEYLSVSQYKNFMGTIGRPACEAEAMAKLNGEWEMKKTTALMVGDRKSTRLNSSHITRSRMPSSA